MITREAEEVNTLGNVPDTRLTNKAVACSFCRCSSFIWFVSGVSLIYSIARKTKCDGTYPRCSNCEKRDQNCVYNYPAGSMEEGSSPENFLAESSPSSMQLPPIQTLPPGTTIPSGRLPGALYWHPASHGSLQGMPPTPVPGKMQSLSRPVTASASDSTLPSRTHSLLPTPFADVRVAGTDTAARLPHGRNSSSGSSNGIAAPQHYPKASSGKRKAPSIEPDEPTPLPAFDSPPKRRRLSEADKIFLGSSSTATGTISRPLSSHYQDPIRSVGEGATIRAGFIPVSGVRHAFPRENVSGDHSTDINPDRRTSKDSIATTPPESTASGHGPGDN